MFKEVSGITWDYKATEIRGEICRGDAEVKTQFHLPNGPNRTENITKLWEMIGTA